VEEDRPGSDGISTASLGIALIVLGAALLVSQVLDLDIGRFGWPLFVVVPGLVLLVSGLVGRATTGLAVGGSVVTAVGLLLLYQNTTDHWESWAYAWGLVAPGAAGLGMALAGLRRGDPAMIRSGTWQALSGLAIFAVGFVFFEGIIGIGGRRLPLPDWSLAALIIAVGVALIIRAALTRQGSSE
jgi:hypothetical protein